MKKKKKSKKNHHSLKNRLITLAIILILIVIISAARVWLLETVLLGYKLGEKGDVKKFIESDGIERSYLVHLPEGYTGEEPVSLVLALHGAGGNAEIMRNRTGLNSISDEKGFIVVYPNGTGLFNFMLSWNAEFCCNYVEPLGVNDVAFLDFLMETLKEDYNINSNQVYLTGVSNGGMMAYYFGCEMTDKIAAIAPVSASMPPRECVPSDTLPVVVFHGGADSVIPFIGGEGTDFSIKWFHVEHKSTEDALSFWVDHNNCEERPKRVDAVNIYFEMYNECENDSEVVFYLLKQVNHVWPGGEKTWRFGGDPGEDINTSKIIWNFFENHARK